MTSCNVLDVNIVFSDIETVFVPCTGKHNGGCEVKLHPFYGVLNNFIAFLDESVNIQNHKSLDLERYAEPSSPSVKFQIFISDYFMHPSLILLFSLPCILQVLPIVEIVYSLF